MSIVPTYWIAVDKDRECFMYSIKPIRLTTIWVSEGKIIPISQETAYRLVGEISWYDEAAVVSDRINSKF